MSARPIVVPPGPWRQPRPDTTMLGNGARLLVHDLPGQQVVAVRCVVPVSLADEPLEHEGVTSMLARLLDEGAGDLDAEAFALALERQGAVLGAGVVDGGLSVDLEVPVRHLERALELFTDALVRPTFPEDEVRRVLRNRVAEYEHESASAPHRAARELAATLWDPDSRAARPGAGQPETIERLDRALIAGRHATLGPAGASLVVAGALGGCDVAGLAEATFGQWSVGPDRPPAPGRPPVAGGGTRVVIVDRPGSVQTEIAIGCAAPGRADGPWAAYPVLAYLLGGSPGARIDAVLREDKGYTYGIRAAMRPRVAGGSFVISGSVRSEVTAEALGLLLGIVEGAREGFSAKEIAGGVDFITRATPGRWATADAVADETVALALEGLPLDFPERTVEAMGGLRPADLDRAMSGLGAEGWAIVLVADAAVVRESVEELGLGAVTVRGS